MSVLRTLITKEIKDFVSNFYSVGIFSLFVVVMYIFLWILPVSSYVEYGVTSPELYFQLISYLFLVVIPLITIGNIGKEYRFGTFELMRSRDINWFTILLSKLVYVVIVSIVFLMLTSMHLWVVEDLSLSYGLNSTQVVGGFAGLVLICGVYGSISLAIGSWIENSTLAIMLSIILCFILYNGVTFISEAEFWSYQQSYQLITISLEHQVNLISKGVLRLSSISYMLSIMSVFMLLSIYSMKKKNW